MPARVSAMTTTVLIVLLAGPQDIQASRQRDARECRGRSITILGTPGDDMLRGHRGSDVIAGRGGADTIHAGRGRDLICGGRRGDRIWGGRGRDLAYGGRGGDTLDVRDNVAGNDLSNGRRGDDYCKIDDDETEPLQPDDSYAKCERILFDPRGVN